MEEFKTIAIFNYTFEIVVLKHRLEQEKIQYYFESTMVLNHIQVTQPKLFLKFAYCINNQRLNMVFDRLLMFFVKHRNQILRYVLLIPNAQVMV